MKTCWLNEKGKLNFKILHGEKTDNPQAPDDLHPRYLKQQAWKLWIPLSSPSKFQLVTERFVQLRVRQSNPVV